MTLSFLSLGKKRKYDVDAVDQESFLVKGEKSLGIKQTLYTKTVKILEEVGILVKHDFKAGKARYEQIRESSHHDHLIDIKSGEIIEFVDEEIEKLQKKVADKYGYDLVDHKLELYGIKKKL